MLTEQPGDQDCSISCAVRGWHFEVEPAQYGIQGSLGWGKMIGSTGGTKRWMHTVYWGWAVRGVVVRPWGGDHGPLGYGNQTLLGIEGNLSIVRHNRAGVLRRLNPYPGFYLAAAAEKIQNRLQHSIYQSIEIWITSTDLVDRVPKSVEENREYHDSYLLSRTYPLDWARIVQPSPTLEVNDIRFGSDKLAHFFSEGWWYYRWWRKNGSGDNGDELQHELAQFGFQLEKWIHGMFLTGVVSPADMEANLQGFVFYHRLCHGAESYLTRYCPLLDSPWVRKQRACYEHLDSETMIDQAIAKLVKEGELESGDRQSGN
jgi:hypothetical protein